jgi:hypothetical protein
MESGTLTFVAQEFRNWTHSESRKEGERPAQQDGAKHRHSESGCTTRGRAGRRDMVLDKGGSVLIRLVAPTFRACPERSEGSADAGLKASATPELGHYRKGSDSAFVLSFLLQPFEIAIALSCPR